MSKIHIPYINLVLQHQSIKSELLAAVGQVLDHSQFILGPEVEQFEATFAEYCHCKYAIGVHSGTDALFLSLKALGIGEGDEVITTPNSFVASASSIAVTGATPVFVDIKEDLNINPDLIESSITKKTKAIIPVHLTGHPADMYPIMDIARRHGIAVIEDCAQAIGTLYHSKHVGIFGDAGCFSLHPLKTLNAIGDGGVIVTNNDQLYQHLIKARNHGLSDRDSCEFWSYNSRLDTIQAAIANVKFKYFDEWLEKRREIAKSYNGALKGLVTVPEEKPNEKCSYHTYIIQTDKRDQLKNYLAEKGIDTKIHYPILIHLQKCAEHLGYKKGDFPVAEKIANRILSLPIYQELTDGDLDTIVKTIQEYFNRG